MIACANILPAGQSLYVWEAKLCEEAEWVMILKTSLNDLRKLEAAIVDAHPAKIPAFIALKVDELASHGSFINWMQESSKNE